MASIEDAADCGERADALVSGVLAGVMRQQRSIAVAMDYVRALSRETRANCWELAEKAGHEGPLTQTTGAALLAIQGRSLAWVWSIAGDSRANTRKVPKISEHPALVQQVYGGHVPGKHEPESYGTRGLVGRDECSRA
jgi:hypothetical protein